MDTHFNLRVHLYPCLVVFAVMFPGNLASVSAADLSDLKWSRSTGLPRYVTIGGCNADATGALDIPPIIDSLPLTSIDERAFMDCSGLTSISIPDTVTRIGKWAFWGCDSITRMTVPSSVSSIGELAFAVMPSLTSIDVDPDNPSYASLEGVFFTKDMQTLVTYPNGRPGSSYTIPDGVIEIEQRAFCPNPHLTSVSIPNSMMFIGRYAFLNCTGLSSMFIPESVGSDGDLAMAPGGIPNLTRIAVSTGNLSFTSLDGVVFTRDMRILIKYPKARPDTSYTTPDGVVAIGERAFSSNSHLTSVLVPDGVTTIGFSAFNGCAGLTSISIPSSVTTMETSAFSSCTSLVDISIPSSVTSIGSSAFSDCTSLTDISIASGVISIEGGAFRRCTNLTKVSIPSSVISIGSDAFGDCTSLTSFAYPSGVTSLGDSYHQSAFSRCTGLSSIYVPLGVTSIGTKVFEGCISLTSVYFMGDALPAFSGRIESPHATIYCLESSSHWGSSFMGLPVVKLSGETEITLKMISGNPTLSFPSVPGERYAVFRFESPGDGGTPLVILDAASSGDTTTFTDEFPLPGGGYYFVLRN